MKFKVWILLHLSSCTFQLFVSQIHDLSKEDTISALSQPRDYNRSEEKANQNVMGAPQNKILLAVYKICATYTPTG